jgi:putative DNA-invertase from lambdoid prophage Rac
MEAPLTAALYCRVSTADQRCEMQLAELRRYVLGRGWLNYKEYVDKGFSGKTSNRPALTRCLADARAHRFDVIVVWKLDRWGRTVVQLSRDVAEFDAMGIRFIAVDQGVDTGKTNAMSKFTLNIMAAFAELEREMLNERVTAGIRHAQKHGTRKGNPFGRPRKIFDRSRVWALRDQNVSIRDIAAKLKLSHGTVQRTLAAARV